VVNDMAGPFSDQSPADRPAGSVTGGGPRGGVHDIRRNDLAQMLDGAVHDLRTPLGAISGWLEVLESELGEVEGVAGKAVAGLRRAVDEQVRMVQQFSQACNVLHEPFDPTRRAVLVDRLLTAASRLDPEENARIGSLEHLRGRSSARCIDGGDRLDDGLLVFLRLLAIAMVEAGGRFTIDGDDQGLVVNLQSRQQAAESLLAFCNGLNRSAAKRANMPLPVLWAARTALIDSGLEPGARVARRGQPSLPASTAPGTVRVEGDAPKVDMIVWLRIVDPSAEPELSGGGNSVERSGRRQSSSPYTDAGRGGADHAGQQGRSRGREQPRLPARGGKGAASSGLAAVGALATAAPLGSDVVAGAPGLGSGLDGNLGAVIDATSLGAGLGAAGFATGGLGASGLAGADLAGAGLAGSGLGAAAMIDTAHATSAQDVDDVDPGGRTILVVDDQKEIREMLALWLRCHQFQVVVAGSAREARQRLAESGEIQAALIDIRMPDEDGISLLRSIRDRESERGERRMPALAITALPSSETENSALEAGFSGLLAKPLKLRQLIELVEKL
jgi:CheY-like chemotaxis protein